MKKKSPKPEPVRGFVADWTYNILILLFGTSTIVQAFVVPTASMEGTVLIGDHLFVDKLAYAPGGSASRYLLPYTEVRRGDVIVFRWPIDVRMNYVKRAIGIPGDRMKIVNKTVHVNGKPLNEPYKTHIRDVVLPYLDNFPGEPIVRLYPPGQEMLEKNVVNGELVVPPGMYFAMGDNRDNSEDSRFWGFVPRENIIGKPWFIWWSYDAPTDRLATGNIPLEHIVDLALNFFSKTRWERTFQLIRGYPL